MKTMANLRTKHPILEDKVDNLEEKMKNKVDNEKVDQLKGRNWKHKKRTETGTGRAVEEN